MNDFGIASALSQNLPVFTIPAYFFAAYTDFMRRIIKNEVSLYLIVLFCIYFAFGHPQASLYLHLTWSMVIFGCLFPLYKYKKLGAGDVKLIGVTVLWVGPFDGLGFLIMTAFFGGALALAILSSPLRDGWEFAQARYSIFKNIPDFPNPHAIPYGIPISVAACLSIYKHVWV